MNFPESSSKTTQPFLQKPWQEAFNQKALLKSRKNDNNSSLEEVSKVSLGFFQSLKQLPEGITAQTIDFPRKFPLLQDNQLLACHGDRLTHKPLIACFKQAHVQEVEFAYKRGLWYWRDWVILTFSDKPKKQNHD